MNSKGWGRIHGQLLLHGQNVPSCYIWFHVNVRHSQCWIMEYFTNFLEQQALVYWQNGNGLYSFCTPCLPNKHGIMGPMLVQFYLQYWSSAVSQCWTNTFLHIGPTLVQHSDSLWDLYQSEKDFYQIFIYFTVSLAQARQRFLFHAAFGPVQVTQNLNFSDV